MKTLSVPLPSMVIAFQRVIINLCCIICKCNLSINVIVCVCMYHMHCIVYTHIYIKVYIYMYPFDLSVYLNAHQYVLGLYETVTLLSLFCLLLQCLGQYCHGWMDVGK